MTPRSKKVAKYFNYTGAVMSAISKSESEPGSRTTDYQGHSNVGDGAAFATIIEQRSCFGSDGREGRE